MEQIKLFFEKVKTDKSLQASLKKLAERKAGVEEIVALAKEKGFGFTKEAFESFVKESLPTEGLSEEQLAAVSGGKWDFRHLSKGGYWVCTSHIVEDDSGCTTLPE